MTDASPSESYHPDCFMSAVELQLIKQDLGWSNGRVGHEIGVSRRTVRRWANGVYKIPGVAARAMREIQKNYRLEKQTGILS